VGFRQVNVSGLVAVSFTHQDSRSGDPDLHTHVAVADKSNPERPLAVHRRTDALQSHSGCLGNLHQGLWIGLENLCSIP
jgi:hypothetical protein